MHPQKSKVLRCLTLNHSLIRVLTMPSTITARLGVVSNLDPLEATPNPRQPDCCENNGIYTRSATLFSTGPGPDLSTLKHIWIIGLRLWRNNICSYVHTQGCIRAAVIVLLVSFDVCRACWSTWRRLWQRHLWRACAISQALCNCTGFLHGGISAGVYNS